MSDELCKHEVDNGKLDMLREKKTDRVQCLKCKEPLSREQLGMTEEVEHEFHGMAEPKDDSSEE